MAYDQKGVPGIGGVLVLVLSSIVIVRILDMIGDFVYLDNDMYIYIHLICFISNDLIKSIVDRF